VELEATRAPEPGRLDTSTPNVARMYHHFLGGRQTFQADRIAAEQVIAAMPGGMPGVMAAGREFIRRVVWFLGFEAGIDQFLDLGVGLPVERPVHTIARQINPGARVAYVDNDPVVVSHGNALLAKPDVAIVVEADLRRPAELLADPRIRAHLDFSRPIAVLLISVLHFLSDADNPHAIVAELAAALPPGSYLALSHVDEFLVTDKLAVRRVLAAYEKANARVWPRSRAEVERFFDGFDLVEPGLVPKPLWRPALGADLVTGTETGWSGVGRLRFHGG
jgi:hypothetical protein